MRNTRWIAVVALLVAVFAAAPAMAQEGAAAADGGWGIGEQSIWGIWGVIGAAFAIGVAGAAGAMGQAKAISAACSGLARNPGAAGNIRTTLIIGLAFIESLVIYALVIALRGVGIF